MRTVLTFRSLFIVFVLFVAGIVGYRYYDYVYNQDFLIDVTTACNPAQEQCFISNCSPEDDLSCPGGPYKKVELLAREAPLCLLDHSCVNFACGSDANCSITYCSTDLLEDGESCSAITNEPM